MITPSPDQQDALNVILSWYNYGHVDGDIEAHTGWPSSHPKRFTFGGFAGTGKSTIIGILCERLGSLVAVTAPTGKAANVLRQKGLGGAQTVHSLIYKASETCNDCMRKVVDDPEGLVGCRSPCARRSTTLDFRRVEEIEASLIIVDEASMISQELMEDLESFGRRVLYIGDHGQLEPVGDDPGLMREPMVRLERIHRQAEGDPIITFAHALRTGSTPRAAMKDAGSPDGVASIRTDGGGLAVVNRIPPDLTRFDAVLCGYNKTRTMLNSKMRQALGFSGALPSAGERVICLKNNRDFGIFNGMQGVVVEYDHLEQKGYDKLTIMTDDGQRIPHIPVDPRQFGAQTTLRDAKRHVNLFDFGYALTVHKAQGSEWDKVLVIEEIGRSWSPQRWRYTAATRASKGLAWVV